MVHGEVSARDAKGYAWPTRRLPTSEKCFTLLSLLLSSSPSLTPSPSMFSRAVLSARAAVVSLLQLKPALELGSLRNERHRADETPQPFTRSSAPLPLARGPTLPPSPVCSF